MWLSSLEEKLLWSKQLLLFNYRRTLSLLLGKRIYFLTFRIWPGLIGSYLAFKGTSWYSLAELHDFKEYQHQTRPFFDHERAKQKQVYTVNL